MISKQKYQSFVQAGYSHIPLVKRILVDSENALALYRKMGNQPYSVLFESVLGGEQWGRYSIIGLPAKYIFKIHSNTLQTFKSGKMVSEEKIENPLAEVEKIIKKIHAPHFPDLPRFSGGMVGYFAYNIVDTIEPRVKIDRSKSSLGCPDILLMQIERLLLFDNLSNVLHIIVHTDAQNSDPYEQALLDIETIEQRIYSTKISPFIKNSNPSQDQTLQLSASVSKKQFIHSVKMAKEYIRKGDAMQIVLSQRLSADFKKDALTFYRALRHLNPSPYLYYLHCGDFQVTGSSPEILVRLEDQQMTVRPLAGTRPRGGDRQADAQLADELRADPKELAEHLMLIDLGRNDLGRVAKIGSVQITEKMMIERYSHVMHLVSNVSATLAEGKTSLDVIRATFPAGTLTGAPKIRAMEIIEELEPINRGIYGGAVGYISWKGNIDMAIAIRTAIFKENKVHVQAGAGIVADSDPEKEWEETMNKAKALLQAAEMALADNQIS